MNDATIRSKRKKTQNFSIRVIDFTTRLTNKVHSTFHPIEMIRKEPDCMGKLTDWLHRCYLTKREDKDLASFLPP